jgi:hypothetical protein
MNLFSHTDAILSPADPVARGLLIYYTGEINPAALRRWDRSTFELLKNATLTQYPIHETRFTSPHVPRDPRRGGRVDALVAEVLWMNWQRILGLEARPNTASTRKERLSQLSHRTISLHGGLHSQRNL